MKQFGNRQYPDKAREMFATDRGLWDAFRRSILYDSMKDSFLFLEAVYTGMRREDIYDQFIPEGAEDQINISHALMLKLTDAAFADPFVQANWDDALVEARNEIENLLNSQEQIRSFWDSDIFWEYHLANGGTADDIRDQTKLNAFVRSFEQHGWNRISLDAAKELLIAEHKTWTPKQLLQRLLAQGLVTEKKIYNPDAAAKHFNAPNVLPLQEFMQKYAYKSWKRAEILADATRCMAAAGIHGSPEDFIDELLNEGFLRAKTPTDDLTLEDFLLRLPQSADTRIEAVLAQIAAAVAADDDDRARELATTLADEMIEQADLSDGATIVSGLLIEYLHHIGRNSAQANGSGATTAPVDGGEDGSGGGTQQNGKAERRMPSVSTFRDTDSHLSLEMDEWLSLDGNDEPFPTDEELQGEGETFSLSEFVLRLPDSVDEMIQAGMGEIALAMSQGDDTLAQNRVDALAFSLVEESAPENAARVNLKELQDYIRQIARNMTRQQDGARPGHTPGPDDDDNDGDDGDDFNPAKYRVSLDSFRDTGSHLFSDNDSDGSRSRTPSEELDEFLADAVDASDTKDGNRNDATGPAAAPSGARQSELLALIRNARHVAGSPEIDRLMREVRNALVAGNISQAQQFARALASLLLGGPRKEPHLQTWFKEEVRKVTITILSEINKALKDDKARNGNQGGGRSGDGPPDRGPGRGPDAGGAGANGATGANGNATATGGGGRTAAPEAGGPNRNTMDRIDGERQSAAPKDDTAALVSAQISEITRLLAANRVEEAKQRAVALSKRLQGNGGIAPEMSAATILKLAHGKVAALRASNPELAPTPAVGGAGDADDDEPAITLDPATAARLVPVIDWKVFCGVYQIEENEIKNIKALALKAVWEPKDAHSGCKSIISRRENKGTVKIKNEKYLAQALVHAVKMKAVKKTLKKPMKVRDAAGL